MMVDAGPTAGGGGGGAGSVGSNNSGGTGGNGGGGVQYSISGTTKYYAAGGGGGARSGGTAGTGNSMVVDGESAPISDDSNGTPAGETLDQVEVEVDIKHHLIFQVVVEMVVLVSSSSHIQPDKYLKT